MNLPSNPDKDHISQVHLSQIVTQWSVVFAAHGAGADSVSEAQRVILERYRAAIYRYIFASLKDRDAADEVFQEFGLRLARGDFGRADPQRGRFRNFLKTTLYRLMVDHHRGRKRSGQSLGDQDLAATDVSESDSDQEFVEQWRTEMMGQTWKALQELERQTGQPLYTVLKLRTNEPELSSAELADRLQATLQKEIGPEWVRKRLFLAREKFTDLLVAEVARSLEEPAPEVLEDELSILGLLDYCRSALARVREQGMSA
jgi:RNA polymerase sigma-70 factor (ECF subfamily)